MIFRVSIYNKLFPRVSEGEYSSLQQDIDTSAKYDEPPEIGVSSSGFWSWPHLFVAYVMTIA